MDAAESIRASGKGWGCVLLSLLSAAVYVVALVGYLCAPIAPPPASPLPAMKQYAPEPPAPLVRGNLRIHKQGLFAPSDSDIASDYNDYIKYTAGILHIEALRNTTKMRLDFEHKFVDSYMKTYSEYVIPIVKNNSVVETTLDTEKISFLNLVSTDTFSKYALKKK